MTIHKDPCVKCGGPVKLITLHETGPTGRRWDKKRGMYRPAYTGRNKYVWECEHCEQLYQPAKEKTK